MRYLIMFLFFCAVPASVVFVWNIQPPYLSPAEAGVRVEKPVGDGQHYSQGSGVFLANGLVLTAAHVVKFAPENPKVTVIIDGWRIEGALVLDGQSENLDLALIKIPIKALSPARRNRKPVSVCLQNPGPSQKVVVAALGKVSDAVTVPTPITSDGQTGNWTNLLSTGYHQGSSGGGVFNIAQNCLWGILNLELSGPSLTDGHIIDLSAFVPASRITPFLNKYYGQKRGAPKE